MTSLQQKLRFLAVAFLVATLGCTEKSSMTTPKKSGRRSADELFQSELKSRQFEYTRTEEGLYKVQIGAVVVTVSLENVRRNYERDGDEGAILKFAKQLDRDMFVDKPDWPTVRPCVRYSLEPSDYESGFDDTLHEVISKELIKVFVYTPSDGSRISWITNSMLADWRVTREAVIAQANKNMDQLVIETKLEIEDIDGVQLGMLSTQETPFKASLILSPRFRDLVSPTHGWPVYVVVPARDFAYVISRNHRDFLGRLGGVVLREYKESGHPVTQDVLEIGDNGVTAIGSFAPKAQ